MIAADRQTQYDSCRVTFLLALSFFAILFFSQSQVGCDAAQRLCGRGWEKTQRQAAEAPNSPFFPLKDYSSTQARYAPGAVGYAGRGQRDVSPNAKLLMCVCKVRALSDGVACRRSKGHDLLRVSCLSW